MSRLLLAAVVAGGVLVSVGPARANDPPSWGPWGPRASSVTWPSVTPPGWYTNTYNYAWYFPWYANYDYTHGPYANWMAGGGYAGYASHGPAGMYYSHKPPTEPYIGEWGGRVQLPQTGSFNTLQGLTGTPVTPPREMEKPKDPNPKKDGK